MLTYQDADMAESMYKNGLIPERTVFSFAEGRGYGLFHDGLLYVESPRHPLTLKECEERIERTRQYLQGL